MKLIGLMPARNEDWVIGLSARVALQWVDHLVILDHASTDMTPVTIADIAFEHPRRVTALSVSSDQWKEMQHRQSMLAKARELGGTHIAIIDADEIVTGNIVGQLKQMVFETPQESMLCLPGYNLRGSIWDYHSNGLWANRWFSVAFPDREEISWAAWGDSFHHREPMASRFDVHAPVKQGEGGVMHLWGVSERRLRAKHALYKMTERLRWPLKSVLEIERQYNAAIEQPKPAWMFGSVPESWWQPYCDFRSQLRENAVPWQEAECQRLYEKHGARWFRDLDLFGVINAKELTSVR
jgi:hypothetical protein